MKYEYPNVVLLGSATELVQLLGQGKATQIGYDNVVEPFASDGQAYQVDE
jgi:hypothetical protein